MGKKPFLKKMIASACVIAMSLSIMPADGGVYAAAKPKLSRTRLNMKVKDKATIKVKGSKIKSVKWKSNKPKVAAVKKSGSKAAKVTAKKKGNAVIKAAFKYGTKNKTLKCNVTVKPNDKNQNTVAPTQAAVTATPVPTPVVTPEPEKTPVPNPTPTPIPVLDMNNLAVADYPTIFSDVPDCDYIRVGGNYYMVSTTMNLCPGVPVMKSTDLVHWEIVNYVYDTMFDDDRNNLENNNHMYGHGSWAAAIRYYEGKYYVIFNNNDYGFFVFTTDDVENGTWNEYYGDRFHDPALIFDEGGMYVITGTTLQEIEIVDSENGGRGEVRRVGSSKQLFKQPGGWSLWEGIHAYKIGEYYYLLVIASPATGGWFRTEVCYRSKKLVDSEPEDWEEQIVYKGSTYEYGTGLAQGGIVDTVYGDWYGILFQDHDAIGRIPSIVAVNWDYTDENGKNYKDWPMMGTYDDNGVFHASKADAPMKIRLNDSGKSNYIVDDDDFTYSEGEKLKLVWQWNHNPDNDNWSVTENPGYYRIRNGRTCNNIWFARNSLTQRTVGPEFTSESAIITSGMKPGDYAGLTAVGSDYGMVGVKCGADGKRYVFQGSGACERDKPNNTITENASDEEITGDTPVYLKIQYKFNNGKTRADKANFFYSLDGSNWKKIGKELSISFSTSTTFMGTRTWLTSYATSEAGGYVDFDYYKQY